MVWRQENNVRNIEEAEKWIQAQMKIAHSDGDDDDVKADFDRMMQQVSRQTSRGIITSRETAFS